MLCVPTFLGASANNALYLLHQSPWIISLLDSLHRCYKQCFEVEPNAKSSRNKQEMPKRQAKKKKKKVKERESAHKSHRIKKDNPKRKQRPHNTHRMVWIPPRKRSKNTPTHFWMFLNVVLCMHQQVKTRNRSSKSHSTMMSKYKVTVLWVSRSRKGFLGLGAVGLFPPPAAQVRP